MRTEKASRCRVAKSGLVMLLAKAVGAAECGSCEDEETLRCCLCCVCAGYEWMGATECGWVVGGR